MEQDRLLLEETFLWGWTKNGFVMDQHVIVSESFLIFAGILCCSLSIQHFVNHVHKWQYLPEIAAPVMVGMIISLIIRISGGYDKINDRTTYFDTNLLEFSPEIFFFGFLPPIVFSSGYHLKRSLLFDNFGGVLSLAVLGTCISITITSAVLFLLSSQTSLLSSASSLTLIECIAFASLIVPTDPVGTLAVFQSLRIEPTLFNLVSGASILNDAISITIFKITSRFIGFQMDSYEILFCFINFFITLIGSCSIGCFLGIIIALIYKYIDFKHHRLSAVSLFISTVYVPFFLAEVLQISGIVTILFTGIASSWYINKYLSKAQKCQASFIFQLIAYLAETSCFCLLGLSIFSQSLEYFRFDLISIVLTLLIVSRAMHVYPLLSLLNYSLYYGSYSRAGAGKKTKVNRTETDIEDNNLKGTNNSKRKSRSIPSIKVITWPQMHMIMFSGLRGAVAFSLANIFPDTNGNKKLLMATTTAIIVVSIFFGGALTNSVTRIFGVKTDIEIKEKTSSSHPSVFRNGSRSRAQPSKGSIELRGKISRGGLTLDSSDNLSPKEEEILPVERHLNLGQATLEGKKKAPSEKNMIV